jgi:hypothetical protein
MIRGCWNLNLLKFQYDQIPLPLQERTEPALNLVLNIISVLFQGVRGNQYFHPHLNPLPSRERKILLSFIIIISDKLLSM